ncbi:MAG: acylneuraminate cytidylyltransferase family protein [Thermodesulfobacteriota bacterium]
MNITANTAWALVTARGGSKSIPLKNLVSVGGKPLLHYCLTAARRAATLEKVVCSTDHEEIAKVAAALGAEILPRPEHLAGDLVSSLDVVLEGVEALAQRHGRVAEIIVLIQPTSIFLTSGQIDAAVQALLDHPEANSSQTVVKVPHQYHAHNQRIMAPDRSDIYFAFPREREIGYSKQTKPVFYTYGNLIVTRTRALFEERTLFARPSRPIEIPRNYAYDLDGYEDIEMAEIMLARKMVAPD